MSQPDAKHCVHGTNIVLDSYPPQYPEYCCQCGANRRRGGRFVTLEGHGPFLNPEAHHIEPIDPWTDSCAPPAPTPVAEANQEGETNANA